LSKAMTKNENMKLFISSLKCQLSECKEIKFSYKNQNSNMTTEISNKNICLIQEYKMFIINTIMSKEDNETFNQQLNKHLDMKISSKEIGQYHSQGDVDFASIARIPQTKKLYQFCIQSGMFDKWECA